MEYSWLLICAILVFTMQAGFLCLESGKIRSKNSINVAAKNISDFILAVVIFWSFGFAFMFGESYQGIIGVNSFFFGDYNTPYQISFFIFQMMFCGTAATLLSGAVAERMTYQGYFYATIVLCAVIYPISGHWAWASIYSENNLGWLEAIGFVDFAGATVVHSVGGSVALAAVLIIGPRIGRFDQTSKFPQGSNLPISVLGVLLIWLGWFGFNGGSTLALNEQVPGIVLNTCIAAVWGAIVASAIHYYYKKYVDITYILNGVIAGLVAITACCHSVSPKASMLIGMIAGLILFVGTMLIEKLKIDDALGVIPAHLFAGVWGTLSVALFSDLEILNTGLSRFEQFNVQVLGIVCIFAFSFLVSFILFNVINYFSPLRVTAENEIIGMNVSEHRASTELIDLLNSMHQQQFISENSTPVPEDPFTEVGQIAKKYNEVIKRVNLEIDERDNAIEQFKSSEKRKGAILNSSMDSIITINHLGHIIEFNPASERIFGYLKRHVINKNFIDLFILEKDKEVIKNSLKYQFSTAQGLLKNHRNSLTLNSQGSGEFPAEISITNTNLGHTSKNEFTLHIRDISRQLKLQNKLKQLAYSDPLTGLYNRAYLINSLNNERKKAKQNKTNIILYFLDLDRFKQVNDTLGHEAGDILLCEVAKRLIAVTRTSDIIARWGGDEFVIMITGELNNISATDKAQEILNTMRSSIELKGSVMNILTSIGITISYQGKTKPQDMIKQADTAMYHAKKHGRNNYQLFENEMETQGLKSFTYEQDMRKYFDHSEQFYFHYQPKVTKDNNIIGLEALIRWQHPTENLISPSIFIPIAEKSDMIIKIGERAIQNALVQQKKWYDQGINLVPISVNISGKHLISGKLVSFVKTQLALTQIPGELLEIEITEGVLLTDIDTCISVMRELKSCQIKISIDDFGTGYSSLSYLKRLPIDILKIDRSFINECASTTEDGQICATIINLAKNLGLDTIAEGVETTEQVAFLTSHDCQYYQGFFFHKPLSADAITPLLQSQPRELT